MQILDAICNALITLNYMCSNNFSLFILVLKYVVNEYSYASIKL